MPAPLEGIKVLDFTRFQNGPHATVMLSDLGAEVLKVERPGAGDPGRSLGRRSDGFCAYFEALDRGKKSITLDLDDPEAKRIVYRLVAEADVLTENFRPGVMDRLGLGYEEVRKHNPRIIYAVNSGFGTNGEWAPRGSFDIVAQGMSGAMIAQGGGPGHEPLQIPWGLADQVGSMVFAYGIMAALFARERYGVGQRVDASQLGAMATLQTLGLVAYLHTRTQANRFVNPTFTFYQGADEQWFTVGVLTPKHWPLLCAATGRADLLSDERSATPFARAEHREWLHAQLASTFRGQDRQHWLDALIARDVPCGPVYDYAGVEGEPQFWENGYLVPLEHPHFPGHRTVGIPLTMSETPGRVQGPAPELGQHTEETLVALGYNWEQIAALRERGAI